MDGGVVDFGFVVSLFRRSFVQTSSLSVFFGTFKNMGLVRTCFPYVDSEREHFQPSVPWALG